MDNSNFEEIMDVMKDEETLKILLYLREFNPNVTIEDLKKLEINEEEIHTKLDKLINLKIIERTDHHFKLSERGRTMVDGFSHDLG